MISSRRRASDASDDYDDDDVTVELDGRKTRRFSSSSSREEDASTVDDDDEDVRMSVMGPKLTLVSRAPWEPGGGAGMLAEEDELDDGSSMLETLSLFGGKSSARGRRLAPKDNNLPAPSPTTQSGGIDWKRPFANTGSRSSSSTRPSREYRSPTTSAVYSNVLGARSAASLSVYSVASAKDLTINAPPMPSSSSTNTTPPNSAVGNAAARQRPPKVRARTTSAGTRSSVFSAASSHSQASDIPPMPRVPFADSPSAANSSYNDLDSPTSMHPYANPDLLGEKDDGMHRSESGATVTSSIAHDDSMMGSMLGPSTSTSSTGAPARSPRGAKSALTINAISTPLPAPPGALGAHNMNGWGAVPGSPSYNLISLEQAQQKVRERTRSVYSTATSPSSPASGVFPPMPPVFQTRSRTTSGVGDPYFPPEPSEPSVSASPGPPQGKTVKTRRSGFLKLFKGGDGGKDKEQPPAMPAMPAVPSRPIPPQQPSLRSMPSQSQLSHAHHAERARAMTSDHVSPTRRSPPSLSVVVTPSPQPVRPVRAFTVDTQLDENSTPVYIGGGRGTPHSSLSPAVTAPTPPKSAPPTVTGFDNGPPLSLRPVSTLFSGLPENLFTPQPSPQSPLSSDGALSPAPELVSGWQRQIADLEGQVRDLRAQLGELRAGAPCEHCGRPGATFGSPEKTPPAPRPAHGEHSDDWRSAGVSVVDRPRARTAGRDRTTFAGMWRD